MPLPCPASHPTPLHRQLSSSFFRINAKVVAQEGNIFYGAINPQPITRSSPARGLILEA
jgi:hypothetical protein